MIHTRQHQAPSLCPSSPLTHILNASPALMMRDYLQAALTHNPEGDPRSWGSSFVPKRSLSRLRSRQVQASCPPPPPQIWGSCDYLLSQKRKLRFREVISHSHLAQRWQLDRERNCQVAGPAETVLVQHRAGAEVCSPHLCLLPPLRGGTVLPTLQPAKTTWAATHGKGPARGTAKGAASSVSLV